MTVTSQEQRGSDDNQKFHPEICMENVLKKSNVQINYYIDGSTYVFIRFELLEVPYLISYLQKAASIKL